MFFILSKIFDSMLSPLAWGILLFLLSILVKSPTFKKRFFYSGFVILIIFSNPFLAHKAFRAWEGYPVPMVSISKYHIGIVLTGVASARSGAPDRVFFGKGADRVLHTVQLYKAGKIKKILISGASGDLINRKVPSIQFKEVFLYSGVPDSAILIEDQSKNTVESARFCRTVIDSLRLTSRFLLITSGYHMRRSIECFQKVGLAVDGYSTDFYTEDGQFGIGDLIIPRESALFDWSVLIHEIFGYCVYKVVGYT